MQILALLILYVVYSKIIKLEETNVYTTDLGGFNFQNGDNIYEVEDDNGFNLEFGRASVTFEIDDKLIASKVKILDFKKLPETMNEPRENNLRQTYKKPRMFDKIFNASFIRHNITSGPCMTMEVAKNHLHYLNVQLKLMSGFRTEYSEVTSYITPTCIACDPTCYNAHGTVLSCGMSGAKAADPTLNNRGFSTVVHFFQGGSFGWAGLGALSNENAWLTNGNYWSLVKISPNVGPLGAFGVAVHEVGHNMGYHHANKPPGGTGFVKKFQTEDGYSDWSNYMGWGSNWFNIPGPAHWMRVNNQNSVFPPWVRQCEDGVNTYRLYAWDYAYTRVFLGDEKRIMHRDNDVVNGLLFKYHTAGLILEYGNNTFNTGLTPLIHGSIAIEYHWYNPGQDSFQNKGIKFTIANYNTGLSNHGVFSMWLNAAVDDVNNYRSSHIPLNYMKMPELDIGTMKFRIVKFHQIKDINPNPALLDEFPKKTITEDDVPYLDIEITHLPNVPFTKPKQLAPAPDVLFSPSLGNCHFKNNAFQCEYFNEFNYWTYVKPGPSRNYTLPRFYQFAGNEVQVLFTGRLGVVSYPGLSLGNHQMMSGSMDIEVIRKTNFTFVKKEQENKNIKIDYYEQCAVKRMNSSNGNFESFTYPGLESQLYDVAVLNGFDESLYKRITLRDIFFNEFSVNSLSSNATKNSFLLFKPLNTQLFGKLYLSLEREVGIVSNQHIITRTFTKTTERISINSFDKLHETYTVTPASLFGSKTVNSFMGPLKIVQNLWYYYPFNEFDLRNYIYVDFEGRVPSNLIMYIETENGIFKKELGFLSRFVDPSTRIQILEISQQTGGWGEIYRFRFNSEVTLLSLRLSLLNNHRASELNQYNGANKTFTIGDDKYMLECSQMIKTFSLEPFSVKFLGNTLTFKNVNDVFTVKEKASDSISSFNVYVIAMVLFLSIFI